jgi:thiol-disulfide isomerase/thioredoxin
MKWNRSLVVGMLLGAAGAFAAPGLESSAAKVLAADDEKKDKPSAKDLAAQIQEALRGRKFDQALELTDQALKLEPENVDLLAQATRLSQSVAMQKSGADRQAANKLFLRSAEYVRRLAKVRKLTPAEQQFSATVLYNEACAFATSDKNKEALVSLQAALEAGFADFGLIREDADFQDLRKLPDFEKIVKAAQVAHKERIVEQIKKDLAKNEPFAFDFKLDSIDGKRVQLADFKGKVLIVDFWGTWCPPCRKEIPHFVALLEKHQAAGLRIVGINYEGGDAEDAVKKIKEFNSSNGVKYPCLIGDDGTRDQVPEFRGYPTTLFVDGSGVVRHKIVGYHDYDHLETIVEQLLEREK